MAKLSQFPVQCSYTCSGGTFHFPPQARKTSLATRFLPYSGGGVHFTKGREGSQKMQAKDESYERPQLCFYSRSVVGCTMKSPRVVTRKQVKGGKFGTIQLFGGVGLGAFSFRRLRKEVRSSTSKAASQNEDGEFTQEAREVVVRVLLEAGLSQEDTAGVVSKAPVFIRELVGCFQELTESDPLASEEGTNATENVNTRDRIYQLANYSRGMSPFLESLGVHLPSVSRLSYSYSSQRLPELLSKVFSHSCRELAFLQINESNKTSNPLQIESMNLLLTSFTSGLLRPVSRITCKQLGSSKTKIQEQEMECQ